MLKWSTIDAVDEFLLSRGMLRSWAIRAYRADLVLFAKAFPELPLTPQPVQQWLNEQKRVRGSGPLAPETVHRRFRSIRAMYRQFWDWHEDDLRGLPNPINKVHMPAPKPKAMRVWSAAEIYAMFTSDLSPRDRALLNLFLDLGPRASECCNLTWNDISPDGFIVLRGKTGEDTLPLSDVTLRLLLDLRPEQIAGEDHVFVGRKGPLTYWGLYQLVRRICRRVGIDGKRASPHTFRHTFGTLYASAPDCDPKVLQALMRHADKKTTDRYIHNNPWRLKHNHAECTPLKIIAAAAQTNFLDACDAVRAAEHILKEHRAVFVPRR